MAKKYMTSLNQKDLLRIDRMKKVLEKIVQMDKEIDNPKVFFPGWQEYWDTAVKMSRKELKQKGSE